MNRNGIVYTVLFTFVIAFFFVFFLSLANNATAPLVRENQVRSVQTAVLKALGIYPADPAELTKVYDENFKTIPKVGDLMKSALKGQKVLIRYFSGSGLWGSITGILAVDAGVDRILGLELISHNETPGLGGRIDEQWFKNQFIGEHIPKTGITILKGDGSVDSDPKNGKVDGITGASLTSASMESIINHEIKAFKGASK